MVRTLDRVGNFLLRWKISKKALAIIFVVLFVLSLVPIVVTAFYSVPVLDDYTFGRDAHLAYVHGESVWEGVMHTFVRFYNDWQGFYSSNFFAACQPYIFNVHLYFISVFTVLFFVISSYFYLFKVIIVDFLKISFEDYILITIPIVEVVVQKMPSIAEGFYWMDGSLTLVYASIFIYLLAFVLKHSLSNTKKQRLIYSALAVLSVIIISGSTPFNFVSYIVLMIVPLYYLIRNKKSTYKLMIIIFALFVIGLIIVVLAPGNNNRTETLHGMSIPKAIVYALGYSFFYSGQWISLLFIGVLAFISVVFYKAVDRIQFSFKYPLLFFCILYLAYASRISISLYAKSGSGALRQLNNYYYIFVLFVSISWLYFVGWVRKKTEVIKINNPHKTSVVFMLLIALILASSAISHGTTNGISTVSTGFSLLNGNTQKYYSEMMDRIDSYISDEEQVFVTPLSVYPSFFIEETLKSDDSFWTNTSIALYYEKQAIHYIDKKGDI